MIPTIPNNAPFTPEQIAWLNGFFAGFFNHLNATGAAPAAPPSAPTATKGPLLVLYGSQSGNAEAFAKRVGREASSRGFAPRVLGMDAFSPASLAQEKNVLVITSTWGEGDMPDNAVAFWEALNKNGASPSLAGVNFSVLALGDRNYGETFCLAGRKFDQRFEELGGRRIFDRVDCDVDYEEAAEEWMHGVFEALGATETVPQAPAALVAAPVVAGPAAAPVEVEPEGAYSKKNPFPAKLLANVRLNGKDSAKDTRHIVFSLAGSGLSYEAGDALGVFPANSPDVVARVMEAHRLDPDAVVPLPGGGEAPLADALLKHYEVRHLVGKSANEPQDPKAFVENLRALQPRLYSIASSPKAHPNEVHLCVGVVRYEKDGYQHLGVASTFLAERLPIGETAGVFVHRSPHFRLPTDPTVPVIMVGPGTGIAPFRAFLQERAATGASGKNWLFFGDQHEATDFLYREELEEFVRKGVLNRLDLAFSRDQERKIYVQNRMMANAMELWRWLGEGAHFYVCGDASRMAKDVDAALHYVAETVGGKTPEEAAEFVAELRKSKRYQRDVY